MYYPDTDEGGQPLSGIPLKIRGLLVSDTEKEASFSVTGPGEMAGVEVTVNVKMLTGAAAASLSMPERSLLITVTGTNQEQGKDQSYTLTLKCHSHTDERTEYVERVHESYEGTSKVSTRYRLKTEKETITWSVAEVVKGANTGGASS